MTGADEDLAALAGENRQGEIAAGRQRMTGAVTRRRRSTFALDRARSARARVSGGDGAGQRAALWSDSPPRKGAAAGAGATVPLSAPLRLFGHLAGQPMNANGYGREA